MLLEGVVTNVAAFGAFVDIGVHQDGLVHVSALANKLVKDPHTVVKPGQIVTVRVIEVDVKRQRIALSMRLDDARGGPATAATGRAPREVATDAARTPRPPRPPAPRRAPGRQSEPSGTMAQALARAKLKK